MRYQGGKNKQWKHIVPIIEDYLNGRDNVWYIEPFMGGGSVFTHVRHNLKLGADIDSDVISMWKHFLQGPATLPSPSDINEKVYAAMKEESNLPEWERKYPSWMHGFVSHACSYGGKKWGGFAHFNQKKNEDHVKEAINGLAKQLDEHYLPKLSEMLVVSNFIDVPVMPNSVIYCDPPYEGTLGYGKEFNHEKFWNWCRVMVSEFNCTVLVSEYNAPKDFRCILELGKKDGMGTTKCGCKQKSKTEKLFVANGNAL